MTATHTLSTTALKELKRGVRAIAMLQTAVRLLENVPPDRYEVDIVGSLYCNVYPKTATRTVDVICISWDEDAADAEFTFGTIGMVDDNSKFWRVSTWADGGMTGQMKKNLSLRDALSWIEVLEVSTPKAFLWQNLSDN